VTSKPDFKVMVLLLVFMQLTRDLFAIAKFKFYDVLLVVRYMTTVNSFEHVYSLFTLTDNLSCLSCFSFQAEYNINNNDNKC